MALQLRFVEFAIFLALMVSLVWLSGYAMFVKNSRNSPLIITSLNIRTLILDEPVTYKVSNNAWNPVSTHSSTVRTALLTHVPFAPTHLSREWEAQPRRSHDAATTHFHSRRCFSHFDAVAKFIQAWKALSPCIWSSVLLSDNTGFEYRHILMMRGVGYRGYRTQWTRPKLGVFLVIETRTQLQTNWCVYDNLCIAVEPVRKQWCYLLQALQCIF